MKTAAAYARYSTEHQTSSSIEYQMRKIDEYCAANGIVIVKRYADEASAALIPTVLRFVSFARTPGTGPLMRL